MKEVSIMKIKFKDFDGSVTEREVKVRNELHFEIQKNTRATTIKPKKGKGSFTRKQKHKNNMEE